MKYPEAGRCRSVGTGGSSRRRAPPEGSEREVRKEEEDSRVELELTEKARRCGSFQVMHMVSMNWSDVRRREAVSQEVGDGTEEGSNKVEAHQLDQQLALLFRRNLGDVGLPVRAIDSKEAGE